MTALSTLLDQIDSHTLLLPEFQRGYVWNRDQVRGLMRSLYLNYPVGSLLVWETDTTSTDVRGGPTVSGTGTLLLDGQQRITSLYGVTRGVAPEFFEGDANAFTGLHFNVDQEVFEFYAPVKMKDDPTWVDVTAVFSKGVSAFYARFVGEDPASTERRVGNLLKLHNILQREFHLEKITGKDKTADVVVDIFNRVNSGGTKLSKGDLALAKITAQSVTARSDMRAAIQKWDSAGYKFKLDWLLRSVTTIATGRVTFRELDDVGPAEFDSALKDARKYIGRVLDVAAGRLGLDHSRVLIGYYGIPILSRYLSLTGGHFPNQSEQDKALYWLVQAGIWGRYSGSSETVLAQDMDALERGGLDGLIDRVRQQRGGSLRIRAEDFAGSSLGARFYPLLYLMTRVTDARDLVTGVPLHSMLLGHNSSLQVHHLFPKAQLYAMQPPRARSEVNAVANFALLTQESNLIVGMRLPEEYLPEAESKFPGVLRSQWIPDEPGLWRLTAFTEFLARRRELLASAANDFLESLLSGNVPSRDPLPRLDKQAETITLSSAGDPNDEAIAHVLDELHKLGLAVPDIDVEVPHPDSGDVIAVAEAFWPEGLQSGRGVPVLLDVDGTPKSKSSLESLGYLVFTSTGALLEYARRESREDSGEMPRQ